jgi:hypothetical protein
MMVPISRKYTITTKIIEKLIIIIIIIIIISITSADANELEGIQQNFTSICFYHFYLMFFIFILCLRVIKSIFFA